MAKLWKRGLVGLFVLAAAGAGIGWYVAAGQAITLADLRIQAMNTKARPDGSTMKISYDKLVRTPFPNIGARLVNPSVELSAPGDGERVQPMHLTWKGQGTSDFITDYLRNAYRFESNGNSRFDLEVGDEKVAAQSQPTMISLMLQARDRRAFSAWQSVDATDKNAVESATADIKAVNIDMGPILIKDAATDEPILSQARGVIHLTNRSTDSQIDFDLQTDIQDSEVTTEYNRILTRVMYASGMVSVPMNDEAVPFSVTRAGKQDLVVDLSVNVPKAEKGPISNGTIDVRKLAFDNNYYHLSLPLNITLREEKGERRAAVKINWSFEATPAAAEEMQRLVTVGAPFIPALVTASRTEPDATREKLLAALPVMSTLGPVKLVLDLDAKVPAPGKEGEDNPDTAELLTLNSFDFSQKRWGLNAKGKGSRRTQAGTTVDVTFNCVRCDTMTQDVFEAARAIDAVMMLIQPMRMPWGLQDTLPGTINQILAENGTKDANSGDISFSITTPAPNDIRINNQPFAAFTAEILAAFAPPTPVEQAPAAGAPAQ